MFFKIFFSYFSFVVIFAHSTNLFQNNLVQQMVSSTAPQLKEELTKAVTNTPTPVATTTNQTIATPSPDTNPPTNLTITASSAAKGSPDNTQNINPPTNLTITGSAAANRALDNTQNINPPTNLTITGSSAAKGSPDNTQNLNPPTNLTITASSQASLVNINSSKPIVITSESSKIGPNKAVAKKEKTTSLYKKYTGFSLTLEDGENYFKNILKSIDPFSSGESLSHLNAARTVAANSNTLDAAIVCFQKVSKGYFRAHSLNSNANGLVTDEYDKSLLHRIFQLNKTDKFSFFIRTGPSHAEEILVFNGLVFSKTGKGNERGDCVCFARYNVEKIKPKS